MTEIVYSRGITPDYTMSLAPSADITLYQMAELLLNRTRQAFEERGVLLPGRQIIYMPPAVVDCEQLAVLIGGYVPTPPWEETMTCSSIRWMGGFDVAISRATPAMPKRDKAPTPIEMGKAAQIASDDLEGLLRVVQGLGEIGPEFQLDSGAPNGGFQTTVLHVQLPAFGGLD